MKLSEIKNGESAIITRVSGHGGFRKRLMEMGFVRGQEVISVQNSPLNDPIKYNIMGYDISLRRSEAEMISVLSEKDINDESGLPNVFFGCGACSDCSDCSPMDCLKRPVKATNKNVINVALVGNPNSGKTSLFNYLTGIRAHVGNYSGVTVDAKTGSINYEGYRINITDLPGTYSITAYSPDERFVRNHLFNEMPDVIINTVVASNIERNLFLTTELIDLNQKTVIALNMYDEFEASGAELDYEKLGAMIGMPMVPTVAKIGRGLHKLLDIVIEIFEDKHKDARSVNISYGSVLEKEINALSTDLSKSDKVPLQFPLRYWALKLLVGDEDATNLLAPCPELESWKGKATAAQKRIKDALGVDAEAFMSDSKFGFITGALHEMMKEGKKENLNRTWELDKIIVNKWLGFPIFIALMFVMFLVTYRLGDYLAGWLEVGIEGLCGFVASILPSGIVNDFIVDGVIAGVGGVAVFLPHLLILYFFISLMEGSGYLARAAFIMDRLMHSVGLHGKSFIPLVMGFGCNVPAIMATRGIESRSSRLITIAVLPFMSCNTKFFVYVLFVGIFFPVNAPYVLISLYCLGVFVAFITSLLLRKTIFRKDETPFVMELPPYRVPTIKSVFLNMWDKAVSFLKKITTVVLVASILIWFLSNFPNPKAENITGLTTEQVEQYKQENSYLGRIGKGIEPVMKPLGLNWRSSIALVTSIPAKEVAVTTLEILYGANEENLDEAIIESGDFTPSSALAFMVFILLFFPCIATVVAIKAETGRTSWAIFTMIYDTLIAWLFAFLVYNVVELFI